MPTEECQMPDDPERGTGRTTGLMFKAIGEALLHPDRPVKFRDHYHGGRSHLAELLPALRSIIASYGLTIDTVINGDHITVLSPISRMRGKEANRRATETNA